MRMSDKEVVEQLLSNDDPAFEDFFFNNLSVPLLNKIRWNYFDNLIPLNELANELMLLLKKDNWKKLRTFDYRTTLFGWLKTVALRHFNAIKNELMPKEQFPDPSNGKEELDIETNTADDIKNLLGKMVVKSYRDVLQMKYIEHKSDETIREELSVSEELYKKLKSKAEAHLFRVIRNEGEICSSMFIKVLTRKIVLPPETIFESIDEINSCIDVENLVNRIPNERIRIVIRSLILKEMDVKDVAEELGTSVDNVYVLKHRAIKTLTLIVKNEKEKYHGRK